MWRELLDGAGRKNQSIYGAFALSLFLHGLVLFFPARNAANEAAVTLAFNPSPSPIEVRIIPAQTKPAPLVKPPSVLVRQIENPPVSQNSRPEGARKIKETRRPAIPKLLDLKTGHQLSLSYWRGAQTQGQLRIRLTVNPSGFIDKWELLAKVPMSLQLDPEALNVMVRNMDADKTGETHILIWECQVGKKNGELIAKIYR